MNRGRTKAILLLPPFAAAICLFLAYSLKSTLLTPIILDTLEVVLARQTGRPVALQAERISGTWFRDLTFEELRLVYGETRSPAVVITAAELGFEYDLDRLIRENVISGVTRVRAVDLAVDLKEVPRRAPSASRAAANGQAVTDRLAELLMHSAPTPEVSLEGVITLPHGTVRKARFRIAGHIGSRLTTRLELDGVSMSVLLQRSRGRLAFDIDAAGTTGELSLRGSLEARKGAHRHLVGSARVESGESFADLRVSEREARFSVLATPQGVTRARKAWTRLGGKPLSLPPEVSVGETRADGTLMLTTRAPASVLSQVLSSAPSLLELSDIQASVAVTGWEYAKNPFSAATLRAQWEAEGQRLVLQGVHQDVSAAGGTPARNLELELTETSLSFTLGVSAETLIGVRGSLEGHSSVVQALPKDLTPGDLLTSGELKLIEPNAGTLVSILLSDPLSLPELSTARISIEASGWQYKNVPTTDASFTASWTASWNPGAGRIRVESLRVEALPLLRLSVEAAELDIARTFPLAGLGRAALTVSDTRALLELLDPHSDAVPSMSFALSSEATEDRVSVQLRDAHRNSGENDAPLASVEASGDLLRGGIETGAFLLRGMPLGGDHLGDASGRFSGKVLSPDGRPVLDVDLVLNRLRLIPAQSKSAEARVEDLRGTLSVRGTPSEPQFDLSFGASGVRLGDTVFEAEGRVSQDDRSLVVHRLQAEGRTGSRLRAEGRFPVFLGPDGPLVRSLRTASFSFFASAPSLHRLVSSDLHAVVPDWIIDLRGRLDEETGDLTIRAAIRAGDEVEALASGPEIISAVRVVEREDDRIDTQASVIIDDWVVLEHTGEILIPGLSSGNPALSSSPVVISSRSRLDFPLSVASGIVPRVLYGAGRVEATLTAKGPVGAVASEGSIRLFNGGLRIAGSFPELSALNGRVAFDPLAVSFDGLSGELGRAPFVASGRYDYAGQGEPSVKGEIRGRHLLLVSEPDLRVRGDVDLSVAGPLSNVRVSGDIRITDARYTRNVPLLQLDAPPSVDGEAVQLPGASGPLARATTLDIGIRGRESVAVINNVYRGSFSVDARVFGTLEVPVVTGRVFADSGTLRLPVTDVQLSHLAVTFPEDDPFSPRLQAQGGATVRNYDVFVRAFGTLPNIEVDIGSNPPLPREQAILLLTTGQPDLAGFGTWQRSVMTAGRVVGRRLSRLLFGPESVADDSALGRVEIAVGQTLSQEGNPVIAVDFALSSGESWFLEFERDRYDHYNLSLIWRFSFR